MRRALLVITLQCVTRSVAHNQLVSRIALVNVKGEKRTHTHKHTAYQFQLLSYRSSSSHAMFEETLDVRCEHAEWNF